MGYVMSGVVEILKLGDTSSVVAARCRTPQPQTQTQAQMQVGQVAHLPPRHPSHRGSSGAQGWAEDADTHVDSACPGVGAAPGTGARRGGVREAWGERELSPLREALGEGEEGESSRGPVALGVGEEAEEEGEEEDFFPESDDMFSSLSASSEEAADRRGASGGAGGWRSGAVGGGRGGVWGSQAMTQGRGEAQGGAALGLGKRVSVRPQKYVSGAREWRAQRVRGVSVGVYVTRTRSCWRIMMGEA